VTIQTDTGVDNHRAGIATHPWVRSGPLASSTGQIWGLNGAFKQALHILNRLGDDIDMPERFNLLLKVLLMV